MTAVSIRVPLTTPNESAPVIKIDSDPKNEKQDQISGPLADQFVPARVDEVDRVLEFAFDDIELFQQAVHVGRFGIRNQPFGFVLEITHAVSVEHDLLLFRQI